MSMTTMMISRFSRKSLFAFVIANDGGPGAPFCLRVDDDINDEYSMSQSKPT